MVARGNCKTLNDLKGKKIVLQENGPHVGMLADILRAVGLKWKDVTIVWTSAISGKDGPADRFREDSSIDACFVISPDMQTLTGGLERAGTGVEKTVKGARVLVSTVNMKRSIADVYAVRKDFYDANKATVEKLTAGYLKACDELLRLKARASKDRAALASYKEVLELARKILGKESIPNEVAANRLLADAVFVGLPGNRAFFKDKDNPGGFAASQKHALDLAVSAGFARERADFSAIDLDYGDVAKLVNLPVALIDQPPLQWARKLEPGEPIFSFSIPLQAGTSANLDLDHANDFKRAVELLSLFGNTTLVVRGHAEPGVVLQEFVKAGLEKKVLTRKGEEGSYTYHLKDGKKIDLDDPKSMKTVVEIIKKEKLKGSEVDPLQTLGLCEKLAQQRADTLAKALRGYAASKKVTLGKDRIKAVGVSILEPIVARPKKDEAVNRRVELRFCKIKGGAPAAEPTENPSYDY